MSDMIERGQDWLNGQLQSHVSTTITYWRDADSVTLTATVGRSMLRLSGSGDIYWTDRDYIFLANDLVLNGVVELPKVGDEIRHVAHGVTAVYEVLSPGGEPHFRYADNYHTRLRVHCKKVRVES